MKQLGVLLVSVLAGVSFQNAFAQASMEIGTSTYLLIYVGLPALFLTWMIPIVYGAVVIRNKERGKGYLPLLIVSLIPAGLGLLHAINSIYHAIILEPTITIAVVKGLAWAGIILGLSLVPLVVLVVARDMVLKIERL